MSFELDMGDIAVFYPTKLQLLHLQACVQYECRCVDCPSQCGYRSPDVCPFHTSISELSHLDVDYVRV